MDNGNRYFGITIGPIYETLSLTNSPAGMWAASFLFSELSYRICKGISESGLRIVTPFYRENEIPDDKFLTREDGVGLFPDRIICAAGDKSIGAIKETAKKAVLSLAESFMAADSMDKPGISDYKERFEDFLISYLQVHIIAFETDSASDNPILKSSVYLAAIEQEKGFRPREEVNFLLEQFDFRSENEAISKNDAIKRCEAVKNLRWPLWKDPEEKKAIRDLKDIAYDGGNNDVINTMKKSSYYAIVYADGDNMSKQITAIKKTDRADIVDGIREFSERCWDYSRHAAKIVKNYHGITIYAGGDDLLCIVPVENRDNKTVLNLVSEIRKAFGESFGDTEDSPTLSLGVGIYYYKFPLYEAFAGAHSLLDAIKREDINGRAKDTLSIQLQKSSGQPLTLHFKGSKANAPLVQFEQFIKSVVDEHRINPEEASRFFNSSVAKLLQFEGLFTLALAHCSIKDTRALDNCFDNMFDADFHKSQPLVAERLKLTRSLLLSTTLDLCDVEPPLNGEKSGTTESQRVRAVAAMLRFIKFFVEPGREI